MDARGLASWAGPAAAGLIAIALSLAFIRTGTWSEFDEYTHFDYVVKVGEGLRLPPVNDLLGQTAIQTAVCKAAPGFGVFAQACGAAIIDPTRMPYAGASTATGYLPTYYLATGLGARLIEALPGDASWLDSARLMGALYLALAAVLVVAIARRLGASSLVAVSAGVAMAAMPMVLQQFSTVNNDSLAVALSLAAVYAYLRMNESTWVRRTTVAFGLSFLALTVKETAIISVAAVAALSLSDRLAFEAKGRWTTIARTGLASGIVIAAAAIMRYVAYPAMVGRVAENGLQEKAIIALQGTPPVNLVAGNALSASMSAFEVPQGTLGGVWFTVAAQAMALAALGLPLAALLRVSARRELRSPRATLALVVVCAVPVFIIGFLASLRLLAVPPLFQPRYLLPIMVLGIAVAAAHISRPWWRLTLPVSVGFAGLVFISLSVSPHWAG